jgi:hypothetical protein
MDGSECADSRPGRFTPGTDWIGAWVSPRAGLDAVWKSKTSLTLPGIEPQFLGCPVRSYTD